MVGPGRPANRREVCSTDDSPLPDELVLDTSFVFEVLSSGNSNHEHCANFLDRLSQHGTAFYFSRLLEIELREGAMRGAIQARWTGKWVQKVADGRARRRAFPAVEETVAAWQTFVNGNVTTAIEIGSVLERVSFLMLNYGLRSYDAVHIATALHVDVSDAATLDPDWAAIPPSALRLWVPPDRLKAVRARRGGVFRSLRRG